MSIDVDRPPYQTFTGSDKTQHLISYFTESLGWYKFYKSKSFDKGINIWD